MKPIWFLVGSFLLICLAGKTQTGLQYPEGEKHIDHGFISYDKDRQKFVYRQLNIEEYVNQYVLEEACSNDSTFVFEIGIIENFVPGGKARLTISTDGPDNIQTVFDVLFPGREYACFGTSKLSRKPAKNQDMECQ